MKAVATPNEAASMVEARARLSGGSSNLAIYAAVVSAIRATHRGGGTLVDVGCGNGRLWSLLRTEFNRYVGLDVAAYDGFPTDGESVITNLEEEPPDTVIECGDVVASIETIEHLENPRAFFRKLVRLAKPGASIIVTTPNQLSLLSKVTLLVKNQFNAFQERPGLYPAHLTALLEIDLLRIANECGLTDAEIRYSNRGRVPFAPFNWPRWIGGRAFSDNVLLLARKPAREEATIPGQKGRRVDDPKWP